MKQPIWMGLEVTDKDGQIRMRHIDQGWEIWHTF